MPTAVEPLDRTADLRGLRFHWVEWGEPDAPTVLALHGMSAMCRIWDPLARALQDRYRVIALDQRGHGDTSWPSEPEYATLDYVADIEALFEHLGIERADLVALSMGAMNSMAFTAKHPMRVRRLVVVDMRPAVDPDKRPNREQDRRTAERGHAIFPNLEAAFIARKFMHPFTPEHSVRHHVKHLLKQLPDGHWTNKHDPRVSYYWKASDLWPALPGIKVPTLIVRGSESQVLSEKTAAGMRDSFANAELVTIEGAGHTVPEDQPERFVEVIEDFFTRNPR